MPFFKEVLLESGIMLQAAIGFAVYFHFIGSHNFHLAHGAFAAITAYVTITFLSWWPGLEGLAFGAGVLITILIYIGWDRGVMSYFRTPGFSRMIFLMASYSVLIMGECLIQMIWGVEPIALPFRLFDRFSHPSFAIGRDFNLIFLRFRKDRRRLSESDLFKDKLFGSWIRIKG